MQELTTDKSKEYLRKMGITSLTEKDNDLALSIGGLDLGISPLEMAGAYATIANGGEYIHNQMHMYYKIYLCSLWLELVVQLKTVR